MNSCNLGYDIGITSDVTPLLSQSLSSAQLSIFVGSINLFSLFGALISPFVSDRYGRRKTFLYSGFIFLSGCLLQAVSGSFVTLILGRMVLGIGIGLGLAIDPIYISEVSPKELRGQLVTCSEISINIGILSGFIVGFFLEGLGENVGWRVMVGIGAFLPLVLIVLILAGFMPESPRWLVAKGKLNEAREVLRQLNYKSYGDSNGEGEEELVDELMEKITINIAEERNYYGGRDEVGISGGTSSGRVPWSTFWHPPPFLKRMLIVGALIASTQQLTGIDGIQYYMNIMLEASGIASRRQSFGIVILLGIFKLSAVIFAAPRIDHHGRRFMVLLSLSIMILGLLLIAINLSEDIGAWVSVSGLLIFFTGFSIGLGPVCWLVPSEIFPNRIRAKSVAFCTIVNRLSATLVSSTVLPLSAIFGWGGYYFLLAAINAAFLVLNYKILPETKEKSLEQMLAFFKDATTSAQEEEQGTELVTAYDLERIDEDSDTNRRETETSI